jgi:hypothetical protein
MGRVGKECWRYMEKNGNLTKVATCPTQHVGNWPRGIGGSQQMTERFLSLKEERRWQQDS